MDESLVGRTGEPFTMVVELGKIREFARATKSRNPAYDGEPGEEHGNDRGERVHGILVHQREGARGERFEREYDRA